MARLMWKGVLAISLVVGMVSLLTGHQLYLMQRLALGESHEERLLVVQLVPSFEKVLGRDAMFAPQTLTVAWVTGGILTGVGFLGLLILGLQDSSRARTAARQVAPPRFDERDKVSSHSFVPQGLETRAALLRFFSIPCFLIVPILLTGVYATANKGQWMQSLAMLGGAAVMIAIGVFLLRGDKGRFLKNGIAQIDIMTGGLRWVRHGDPTVRTAAWSQVANCHEHVNLANRWKNETVVTLRTGEKIWLWACCMSDYEECVRLVERGQKQGAVKHSGVGGLAAAFQFKR